jgi:hypothetical protein
MAWVSRITAIGLTMFLPGVAGSWLDGRLGTRFAIMWLVQLGNRRGAGRR